MTRQKKEILRAIQEIDDFIAVDMELGCGFAPKDYYSDLEERRWNLLEALARLSHYSSVTEMFNDERGTCHDDTLPFA